MMNPSVSSFGELLSSLPGRYQECSHCPCEIYRKFRMSGSRFDLAGRSAVGITKTIAECAKAIDYGLAIAKDRLEDGF
jgi:hypothetical protein